MTLLDDAPEADLPVIDAQIEPALRVGAHPRLVGDRRAFAAVVGERNQRAVATLLAARPFDGWIGHAELLPAPSPSPLRSTPAKHTRRTPARTHTRPRNPRP